MCRISNRCFKTFVTFYIISHDIESHMDYVFLNMCIFQFLLKLAKNNFHSPHTDLSIIHVLVCPNQSSISGYCIMMVCVYRKLAC